MLRSCKINPDEKDDKESDQIDSPMKTIKLQEGNYST